MNLVNMEFSYDPEDGYSGIVAFRDMESGKMMTQSMDDATVREIIDELKWRNDTLFSVRFTSIESLAAPAPAADASPPPVTPGSADDDLPF